MELRKQIEKEHYNKVVKNKLEKPKKKGRQFGLKTNELIWQSQFYLVEEKIKQIVRERRDAGLIVRFLDYGCGTGIYSILPAKEGAEVRGIDISEESIDYAKRLARENKVEEKTSFLLMDCEETDFSDNFFDIVFNCGSLSCLDRKKAFLEISRILKKDGFFISLDTLGHNPFLNLNRKMNFKKGRRTKQTFQNVLKMEDIEITKDYFEKREIHFYYFLTPALIFFQKLPGFKYFLFVFETIDKVFLKIPFLKKYAFRVIFIFSNPKKNG